MDFEYDCLGGVEEFCKSRTLDDQMKEAASEVLLASNSEEFETQEYDSQELDYSFFEQENFKKLKQKDKTLANNHTMENSMDITNNNDRKTTVVQIDSEEDSSDSESGNPEISVKVQWNSSIEKHPLRKFQKFHDLIEVFSKRENVTTNDVLFNLEDKIVFPDDTPHSINYKFCDIISGRVLKNCYGLATKTKDRNEFSLKIQSNQWKKPFEISINKTDTFKILYIKVAEQCKLKRDEFILSFDGDNLELTDTPNNLELEGGEMIDCSVKKA